MSSVFTDSDFEDISSTHSTVRSFDPVMSSATPASEPKTPSTFASRNTSNVDTSADEYPHDERFYFDDGSVVFIVEGTAYCLHRYLFKLHSTTFAKTFFRDTEYTMAPIFLDGVEKDHFDAFLNVLYRTSYTSDPVLSAAAWASVLHLASEWNFPSIRDLAIKNFTPIASDVDKIVLGHRYKFEEWLLPGYTGLCERKEPLTLEEAMRLGMEDVVAINIAREAIRDSGRGKSGTTINMTQTIRCTSCANSQSYSFDSSQHSLTCTSLVTNSGFGSTSFGAGAFGGNRLCGAIIDLPKITSPSLCTLSSARSWTKDTVIQKVKLHIPRHSFRGKYVSVNDCNPIEANFANVGVKDCEQHLATEQVALSFEDVATVSGDIVEEAYPLVVPIDDAAPAGDTMNLGDSSIVDSQVVQMPDVGDDTRSNVSSQGKKSWKKGKKGKK